MSVRVQIPAPLRRLTGADAEVALDVAAPVTIDSVLDALESKYPGLKGTIRDHVTRKRRVRRIVREVFLGGKKPHEGPPFPRDVVPDRALEPGVSGLQGVEHGVDGDGSRDVQCHLYVGSREPAQRRRDLHAHAHLRVWTSTERTGGRWLTIGAQWSPPSGEPYTWPPVVPKYTPHSSRESIDIASRSTFT